MGSGGSLKMGVVARKKLTRPNSRPVISPTMGQPRTPPRMVGTCSMVALAVILGTGINPRPGTIPMTIVMAASTPARTMRQVDSLQGLEVDEVMVALLKREAPFC